MSTSDKQISMIENYSNDWLKEWVDMPEYNNIEAIAPYIVATFKFRNQADFEEFNKHLRTTIYNNEKVFDGMQRKGVKSTWYPLNEKAKGYRYR